MSGLQDAVASSSTSTLVPSFGAMVLPSTAAAEPTADATLPEPSTNGQAADAEPSEPAGPPADELIGLYKRTHADFFAAYTPEPPPSSIEARDKATYLLALSKPVNTHHSAMFDPDDDLLVIESDTDMPGGAGRVEDTFLGGGEHCTARRDAVAVDYTLTSGKFGLKEWSSTRVSEPSWPEGQVAMEPPYVFARPVKRSVAGADEKVMTYYPTFAVVNPAKAPFDLKSYEEMYEEVERTDRPEAFPFVDAVCYEYLNRVLLLHPTIDFKYIDSLSFLPLTTLEITNLPQHNDMLPFPFPNPSSDRFPAPTPPKLEGQNARHKAIDERWLPGETTYNGVLRDSEGMFCPLPSCGEYDCQIHVAHWEGMGSYVTPKDKGSPTPISTLFLKVGKKACGPKCFTKHLDPKDHSSGKRFSDVLNEVVGGTAAWPDEEVDQLMMLVQTMPTLLPCQMVDVIVTSVGLPKYTCNDYFLQRCKVMDLVAPRPSHTIPVKRPKNGWANRKAVVVHNHHHMRPTRPCNHEGPCSIAQCECHVNKVNCTSFCHCSERECSRRFPGCNCKVKKNGRPCQTDACKCFQAGRECDPVLCGNCGVREESGRCGNSLIQQGNVKRVRVGPSAHGLGLFVAHGEEIRKDDFIIEYVGDVISENESNRRGQIYDQGFRNYQFDLNFNQSVDAYRRGNDSRFINQPDQEFRRRDREPTGEAGEANCYPRVVFVLGQHRIGLYARYDIPAGTELLFDYGQHFDPSAAPVKGPAIQTTYLDDDYA